MYKTVAATSNTISANDLHIKDTMNKNANTIQFSREKEVGHIKYE